MRLEKTSDPLYPPVSRSAGDFGAPLGPPPGEPPLELGPSLPDTVHVVAPHPVHHVLEWEEVRRLAVRLRAWAPASRLEIRLRSELEADAYRGLSADRVEILGRGAGPPALAGPGAEEAAAVLFGGGREWAGALRGAGHRVLGQVEPSFRVGGFDDPRAEAGARAFQRVLAAASPRWTLASGAGWPIELPERARLLVHQARFHLGDALWLTPLLRGLARLRPGVEITVVAPAAAGQLLLGLPYVTRVLPYPEDGGTAERRRVFEALDPSGVDAAIFAFARRPESSWLARALAERGVAHRVNLEYFDPGLDPSRTADWATHEGWFFWSAAASPEMLLRALDPFLVHASAPPPGREVELPFPTGTDPGADEPLVVLAPGGKSSERWPAERFAELAAWLVHEGGFTVGLEGAPEERVLLEEIAAEARRRLGDAFERRLWTATDSLARLTALLGRARLLVANDSAPIHFAEATGTPTLYFAERHKLVHSHPARPSAWALFDPAANEVARISVGQAAAAIREMASAGVVRWGRV